MYIKRAQNIYLSFFYCHTPFRCYVFLKHRTNFQSQSSIIGILERLRIWWYYFNFVHIWSTISYKFKILQNLRTSTLTRSNKEPWIIVRTEPASLTGIQTRDLSLVSQQPRPLSHSDIILHKYLYKFQIRCHLHYYLILYKFKEWTQNIQKTYPTAIFNSNTNSKMPPCPNFR